MGYTHYWYRKERLNKKTYAKAVKDIQAVVANAGIPLASWDGTGKPEISEDKISFNGVEHCGHPKENLGIAWPSERAGGVAGNLDAPVPAGEIKSWGDGIGSALSVISSASGVGTVIYANGKPLEVIGADGGIGQLIDTRKCGGDCSHESFTVEPYKKQAEWNKDEKLVFSSCKTAFKPYDLIVIASLIILKHHFGDEIIVSSNGTNDQWFDGKLLCYQTLGYGLQFKLDEDEE